MWMTSSWALRIPAPTTSQTQKAYPAVLLPTTRLLRMLPSKRGNSCSAPARLVLPAARYVKYLNATRPVKAHMIFLANDWYWKDKDHPLQAMQDFVRVKRETGVPLDSFTFDDGWDFDWDQATGLWKRLGRKRFPGGWDSLQAVGHAADIGVSLWFGPIGGYATPNPRAAFGKTQGFEVNGDKLCLAGPCYQKHVIESFSQWAAQGMNYIKVDGFWPDCSKTDHGHAVGPGGTIEQMDALMRVFAAWRKANPKLVIGYTTGSNPSPFWLQHCDYVWRGGADDQQEGEGEPFDRYHTFVDGCLQSHRCTEMPISGFVTFDIVHGRTQNSGRAAFERGVWWLAARTSLHHDWYLEAKDLTTEQWKLLARAAKWAKAHETVFRFSRMIGGNPKKAEIYGFAAFDDGAGTLAIRNPSDKPRRFESRLADLLDLSDARTQACLSTARRLRSDQAAGGPTIGFGHPANRIAPLCGGRI